MVTNRRACCADGLLAGFHRSMSVMSWMASFDPLGMRVASGVAVNCGNLKFMAAASLKPSPHSRLSGVPSTEQILNISSISEFPGKSGRNVYSSAMMHPTALPRDFRFHWSFSLFILQMAHNLSNLWS